MSTFKTLSLRSNYSNFLKRYHPVAITETFLKRYNHVAISETIIMMPVFKSSHSD